MEYKLIISIFILLTGFTFAQTKVSGMVVDNDNQPVPYANVVFKGTAEGVVTNEDGRFYLESEITYKAIIVSFSGFETKEVTLPKSTTYNFVVKINDSHKLKEVVIFTGKTSKKNNPALDILRKIWERRRKNGLKMFKQYQYEKYEKI